MMKKLSVFFLYIFSYGLVLAQQPFVAKLKCQYQEFPLGVDDPNPRLSWQLSASRRNVKQSAYRILVADDKTLLQKNMGNLWDSKKVRSGLSVQVAYAGGKLHSGRLYYWKVMVWDDQNVSSNWSELSAWQMGLLTKEDWAGANWIGYDLMPDSLRIVPGIHGTGDPKSGLGMNVLPLLRKEFSIRKTVKKATAFVAGLGHFELSLNGNKIGNHFLDAGWTQYSKNALYVTFDITNHLKKGDNTLGMMLGNGFYYTPRDRYRKITIAYGFPKMICRVFVEFADGSSENIVSDNSWKTNPGPITFSSIYGGEDYDATKEQPLWNTPDFDDHGWRNAKVVEGPPILNAQTANSLIIADTFSVKEVSQPSPSVWVYDFGQNASGIFKVKVMGKKYQQIVLRPAELLTDKGLVTQDAVGAPVFFNYTLKGEELEVWQPRFTYYGFRYIQIEGAVPQGVPNPDHLPVIVEIESLHTRNGAGSVGRFSCSNDLFNRTNSLINWAIKSNMASVFTDCPHREKLGWLEESHLMGASVNYNFDIAPLCVKVIKDIIDAQTDSGLIPDIAPEYVQFKNGFRDSPEWGSAGIILPWYVYQWYGDINMLKEAYPMMQRYAEYLLKKSKNDILSYGLGDWFDIGAESPGKSQLTPKGVTATAILYYDLRILVQVAKLIGTQNDIVYYQGKAEKVRSAFNEAFFDRNTKQYATGSQTANAMAVYMKLVEPQYKNDVVENIIKDIKERGSRLTAGDIGYRYVLRVLEQNGHSDVIFEMNSRSDIPGYGFQLANGATALTESWQAYRFVSNNHFMLGHLMEWFYSGLCGIGQVEGSVAFKHIEIRPQPVGDVKHAMAEFACPYGLICVEWQKEKSIFTLDVSIPANTSATIFLPVSRFFEITESGMTVRRREGIKILGYTNGEAKIAVGSGRYHFQVITK